MSIGRILVDGGDAAHRDAGAAAALEACEARLRERWPSARVDVRSSGPADPRGDVRTADLVVLSGRDVLADAFAGELRSICALVEAAAARRIPVALMGQGVGRLTEDALRAAAGAALPRATMISVRETRFAPVLLFELGVAPHRVIAGCDDAFAVATPADGRLPEPPGRRLGVALRPAPHAAAPEAQVELFAGVVRRACERLDAEPWAVATAPGDADLAHALTGAVTGAGAPDAAGAIARVRECRAVVTASYAAAIFALAQGVPVVACAHDPDAAIAFTGLQAQFLPGVQLVHLDGDHAEHWLAGAIDQAWLAPPEVPERLVATGALLARRSAAAYDRLAVEVQRGHAR